MCLYADHSSQYHRRLKKGCQKKLYYKPGTRERVITSINSRICVDSPHIMEQLATPPGLIRDLRGRDRCRHSHFARIWRLKKKRPRAPQKQSPARQTKTMESNSYAVWSLINDSCDQSIRGRQARSVCSYTSASSLNSGATSCSSDSNIFDSRELTSPHKQLDLCASCVLCVVLLRVREVVWNYSGFLLGLDCVGPMGCCL